MNSRKIEPISFWSPNGQQEATSIRLHNFHGYNFDGSSSSVSYRLGFTQSQADSDEWFVCLAEGSVTIPDEVVQDWGADDECIFNHVITQLGLRKI